MAKKQSLLNKNSDHLFHKISGSQSQEGTTQPIVGSPAPFIGAIARAGIKAHIFAPSTAPKPKLEQIAVYGAQTHLIEGARDDSTKAAILYSTSNSIPS